MSICENTDSNGNKWFFMKASKDGLGPFKVVGINTSYISVIDHIEQTDQFYISTNDGSRFLIDIDDCSYSNFMQKLFKKEFK